MTLELSPELETQIERAAQQQGTDAPTFAIEALRVAAQSATAGANTLTKEERRAAIARLKGRYKDSTTTVDDFLAERSAEGHREAGL